MPSVDVRFHRQLTCAASSVGVLWTTEMPIGDNALGAQSTGANHISNQYLTKSAVDISRPRLIGCCAKRFSSLSSVDVRRLYPAHIRRDAATRDLGRAEQ